MCYNSYPVENCHNWLETLNTTCHIGLMHQEKDLRAHHLSDAAQFLILSSIIIVRYWLLLPGSEQLRKEQWELAAIPPRPQSSSQLSRGCSSLEGILERTERWEWSCWTSRGGRRRLHLLENNQWGRWEGVERYIGNSIFTYTTDSTSVHGEKSPKQNSRSICKRNQVLSCVIISQHAQLLSLLWKNLCILHVVLPHKQLSTPQQLYMWRQDVLPLR